MFLFLFFNQSLYLTVGGTGWSAWSPYGPCDINPFSCTKKRQRFCMDPHDKTSCAGPVSTALLNWGVDEETKPCSCSGMLLYLSFLKKCKMIWIDAVM